MPIDPSAAIPPDTPLSKIPNFDPRTVPVVGIDTHLPRVPAVRLAPEALRRRFEQPPAWARRFPSSPPATR